MAGDVGKDRLVVGMPVGSGGAGSMGFICKALPKLFLVPSTMGATVEGDPEEFFGLSVEVDVSGAIGLSMDVEMFAEGEDLSAEGFGLATVVPASEGTKTGADIDVLSFPEVFAEDVCVANGPVGSTSGGLFVGFVSAVSVPVGSFTIEDAVSAVGPGTVSSIDLSAGLGSSTVFGGALLEGDLSSFAVLLVAPVEASSVVFVSEGFPVESVISASVVAFPSFSVGFVSVVVASAIGCSSSFASDGFSVDFISTSGSSAFAGFVASVGGWVDLVSSVFSSNFISTSGTSSVGLFASVSSKFTSDGLSSSGFISTLGGCGAGDLGVSTVDTIMGDASSTVFVSSTSFVSVVVATAIVVVVVGKVLLGWVG